MFKSELKGNCWSAKIDHKGWSLVPLLARMMMIQTHFLIGFIQVFICLFKWYTQMETTQKIPMNGVSLFFTNTVLSSVSIHSSEDLLRELLDLLPLG